VILEHRSVALDATAVTPTLCEGFVDWSS